MSTESRLSIRGRACGAGSPQPPCSVSPPTPVVETTPPGVASPKTCVSRSTSPQVAPPWTRAVRAAGSTWTPRIGERSITSPPSLTALPATLCPPPRTESSRSLLAREVDRRDDVGGAAAAGDQRGLAVDQAVPDRAGRRRSPASPGPITRPRTRAANSRTASDPGVTWYCSSPPPCSRKVPCEQSSHERSSPEDGRALRTGPRAALGNTLQARQPTARGGARSSSQAPPEGAGRPTPVRRGPGPTAERPESVTFRLRRRRGSLAPKFG